MRAEWLSELVESAAAEQNVSKEVELKQIVEENRLRKLYRRLKPLGKGIQSGALAMVKTPKIEWFYSPKMDMLFNYSRGSFYAHARLESLEGDDMPFSKHRTRIPLPKGQIKVATVIDDGAVLVMEAVRVEDEIWEEVTESEKLRSYS